MAELTFDPNEYLRNMARGPRTAEMFQEGQRTAANISAAQLQQQAYQQEMDLAAAQAPYKLAALEQQRQAGDIALRQAKAQEAARQEYARGGTGLSLPEQLKPPVGAGYMAPVEAPEGGGVTPPSGLGGYTTVGVKPASYDTMMQRAEGVGRNPLSTAQGPGQFIDSTFIDTFKKTFPSAAGPMTDAQILATRGTGVETAMLKKFTEDNQSILASRGIPVTNTNTYLAHFLGAGGATRALTASPDTPINQVVDPKAIAANPQVFNQVRTVRDLQNWAASKMGENVLSPTPMGGAPAGLREPSASPDITAALQAKPGVPAPAPTAMTYLRNPTKLNGDMQVVVAQDRQLELAQKYYAQSGDIAQAAETGLKRVQLRNTYQSLQGLQAITNFDLGDNVSLGDAMSRATGRQIGIQPLTNGNFNLVVSGQPLRQNIPRAELKNAAQYMLSDSYRALSMEMEKKQFDLQIELLKEKAKAGYKIQEKQYDKLYEGATKLQVERLKLSGMKVVEGEDGKFFVYRPDGSYAAYVDPQGEIVLRDGTKLDNPSVSNIPLMIPTTATR
jgi:hypothetical protein